MKHLRILLVEDNDINRLYASSILKMWECQVEMAENGEVALAKARSSRFDVILMDVQMPIMDGYETTKAIRLGDHGNSQVPIIALTANTTARDVEKCLNAGMNTCITKPFTPEDLQKALVESTRKSQEDGTRWVIDLSYLKRVSGNNDAFMKDMIKTFVESIPKSIEEIRSHTRNKDWDNLSRTVHKIRPSLSMMGLHGARDAVANLENSAKERNNIGELPAQSELICAQLETALEDLRLL